MVAEIHSRKTMPWFFVGASLALIALVLCLPDLQPWRDRDSQPLLYFLLGWFGLFGIFSFWMALRKTPDLLLDEHHLTILGGFKLEKKNIANARVVALNPAAQKGMNQGQLYLGQGYYLEVQFIQEPKLSWPASANKGLRKWNQRNIKTYKPDVEFYPDPSLIFALNPPKQSLEAINESLAQWLNQGNQGSARINP